ncbi:MAG: hypothetical protein ACRETW_01055 [Stenotrophobium sp.]
MKPDALKRRPGFGPRYALALAAALLLPGCAATPQKYLPLVIGDTPEVVIHRFPTDKAGKEYQGDTDFGRQFAEYLAGALQQRGVRALVAPEQFPDEGVRYVVDGDITRIHPGAADTHFRLLFWQADQADFAVGIRMTDRNDSEKIFTAQAEENYKRTENDDHALLYAAAGAADDLAKIIAKRIDAGKKKE